MGRKTALLLTVVITGLILDQASKLLVLHYLPLGGQYRLVDDFFNLVHVHNKGVAFGLMSGWSVNVTRWFFMATTTMVAAVVLYLWHKLPADHLAAGLGYSLILAGALGNLLDRARLGEVVDFLDVYWGRYHWPAFNIADSLVCVGAGLLVVVILTEEKRVDASDTV
jgi:signal peptidase II